MAIQTQIVSGTQIHKVGSSYRTFYVHRICRASILKQEILYSIPMNWMRTEII